MFRLAQRQLQGGALPEFVCKSRFMSSLSFKAFGEPSTVLRFGESKAVGEPAAGQVKVSLKASPVTHEDIRSLKGHSVHRSKPGVGGMYGVGTVSSVGSGVVGVSPSSQVFVASKEGTWNSEAVLSSQEVFAIEPVDSLQAALLPAAASAWALLNNFAPLVSGDVVLRSAEPSALNSAIDQIAKTMGLVVLSASDADLVDAKFKDKVAASGSAKLAISSGTGKAARALLALTHSKGVLVTYNGAPVPLSSAMAGVEVPSLGLIFKDQTVCGFDFSAWVANSPAEASQAISESVKLMQSGQLQLSPSGFSASKFSEAVAAATSGKSPVIEL